jgi:iron complex transport system substrate-binding protein
MKTKNKVVVLLEIAIVLCSVFLVAIPSIAADQTTQEANATTITTSSEDDYVLGVYGNANEDNTIDMRDLTYVKLIFFGKKPETELADAKYDGKINPLDFIQIKLIIVGKEKELTLVDSVDRIVTVKKPVERVVIAYWIDAALTLQSLKAEEVVVGVTQVIVDEPILFPELSELPSIGYGPIHDYLDYEKILELEPDVVLTGGAPVGLTSYDEIQDTIQSLDPDIVVLRFDCCYPSSYTDEVRKCGYIFDREEEAKELIDFIEEHLSTIEEIVSDIPSDVRTKVYTEFFMDYYTGGEGTVFNEYIEMAGGKNIFSDISGYLPAAEPEAVIAHQPEVIIHHPGMGVSVGYQTDDVTEMRNKRDEIRNRAGFANVPAVDSGRVYMCMSNLVLNAIYPVGVTYYAKWFYPDEFAELDPNEIHQEYLTRFLRIDYDLDNHGVFVYHPEQHPDGR